MIANTANPAAPNEDGSIGVTAAGAGKRDLRPWKREVSALPGSTSLTSSEQTPTDTSVGPLVTPIYDVRLFELVVLRRLSALNLQNERCLRNIHASQLISFFHRPVLTRTSCTDV